MCGIPPSSPCDGRCHIAGRCILRWRPGSSSAPCSISGDRLCSFVPLFFSLLEIPRLGMPDRVRHDGFTSLPPAKRGDRREVFSIWKHNLANLTSVRYWPVWPDILTAAEIRLFFMCQWSWAISFTLLPLPVLWMLAKWQDLIETYPRRSSDP